MSVTLVSDWRIGGVPFGPFTTLDFDDGTVMRAVNFGARHSDDSNDFDIRNIKVGTAGFGSSNVWNPVITSTVVPPFDSLVGSPAGISAAAGIITVLNAGAQVYGVKDLGADYVDLYTQFELRVRPIMLTQFTCDYFMVRDQFDFHVSGIINSSTPEWVIDQDFGYFFGSGPPSGTWVTVGAHLVLSGAPPPPAAAAIFDSTPAFKTYG